MVFCRCRLASLSGQDKYCLNHGLGKNPFQRLTLRCAQGRLPASTYTANRYRQVVVYHGSSSMTTERILLPRHFNLDMTIFCFLSGLCHRAKILKFIFGINCTHLQAPLASPAFKACKRVQFVPGLKKLIHKFDYF